MKIKPVEFVLGLFPHVGKLQSVPTDIYSKNNFNSIVYAVNLQKRVPVNNTITWEKSKFACHF